mmetsp:Transcript_98805/g.313621  ORF Transcript_98805/g.313621 Transcript_98805/m.313621 type:complete len:451 (-) Transcript_98805:169-1521(-)
MGRPSAVPAGTPGHRSAPPGDRSAPEAAEVVAAELLLGRGFDRATWRRPLCLNALTAEGRSLAIRSGGWEHVDTAGRCAGGRRLGRWSADKSTLPICILPPEGGSSNSSEILTLWRRLNPGLADPDGIQAAWEYFPLGPATRTSRSFLRVHLREADEIGHEVFVVRPEAGQPSALMRRGPCWSGWWPLRWPRTEDGHSLTTAGGVCVLRDEAVAGGFGLPELRAAARDADRSASGGAGFLPGTPWAERCRVCRVEEHCRSAHLGLWGFLFRLKHSVLAVHLRREARDDAAGADLQDMLYIDKNADVGVGWRRAGFREAFSEAPRAQHSFDVDMPVHHLWSAVTATSSFAEAQEVSNCQHFVRETLAELAARGHFMAPDGSNFTLRNQWLADALRTYGFLDEACKGRPGNDGMRQTWRLLLSWGCKVGTARLLSPWAESFVLQQAAMTGAE